MTPSISTRRTRQPLLVQLPQTKVQYNKRRLNEVNCWNPQSPSHCDNHYPLKRTSSPTETAIMHPHPCLLVNSITREKSKRSKRRLRKFKNMYAISNQAIGIMGHVHVWVTQDYNHWGFGRCSRCHFTRELLMMKTTVSVVIFPLPFEKWCNPRTSLALFVLLCF
jgi:hypothetical protein